MDCCFSLASLSSYQKISVPLIDNKNLQNMRFFKLLLSAGSTLSLKLLNFPVAGKNPYRKPFPIRSLTQLFYLEEAWLNFFVTLRDGFKKLNAFSITFDSISKLFFLRVDPETNRLSDQVKKDRL